MYKTLPTNTRPLALDITPKEFTQEWVKCVQDKTSDLSTVLSMMQPVFDNWKCLLSTTVEKDDISYITLCKLLSPEPEKAREYIDLWLEWIKVNSDIISELQYIFIERIRKFRYVPTLANAKMIEYIVAKDLKLGIYHHMRYTLRLLGREALYHADIEENLEVQIVEIVPDFLLLKKIDKGLNKWQSYLFYMIREGYSSVHRSELTKIHRRNLYNEEKKIWHLIKQTL